MGKHILILLNFWHEEDGAGPYYCPDCATVEGFLSYSPEIRENIDIRRVDFQKPRKEIVDLIGPLNQNSPVLILDEESNIPSNAKTSLETGKAFFSDVFEICNFLGQEFDCVRPHP
jgi:hypothetical protein